MEKAKQIAGTLFEIHPLKKVGAKGYTIVRFFIDTGMGSRNIINVTVWHDEARKLWDKWLCGTIDIGTEIKLYGMFGHDKHGIPEFTCNTIEYDNPTGL